MGNREGTLAHLGARMTAGRTGGKARLLKHLVGAGITLLCLVVFVRQVNISDVFGALAHFHWIYLVFGVWSLAAGYALRIVRWSMMLKAAGADASFGNCAAPFLGSIALNNVLPLRLGDVVRALNALGATPQDLLAILQAIKAAGALNAELEVI